MARALLEAGHHPDMLYGTSAGALNAAWLAVDPTLTGTAGLARLWTTVRRRDVFPLRPVHCRGRAGRPEGQHLFSAGALARWLRATTALRRLEDGVLPLTVVATDLETGEEVLLDNGPAVPALLASSAMPGIFPPVRIGHRWMVDGSVASDTPVGPAVRAGAGRVWVLPSVPAVPMVRPGRRWTSCSGRSPSHWPAIQRASWPLGLAECELYVLPAPLVAGVSPFNFDRSRELIDAAYRLTVAALEDARPIEPGARAARTP